MSPESALPASWTSGSPIAGRSARRRAVAGLVDVIDPQRVADVLLQRGHEVVAGEAGRGFLDLVKTLFEVGHFGLAHRLLELTLEFGSHLAGLAHPLPDHAQHARQLFRADGDQRDNRDDDQFTPPDVEHEKFRSREAIFPRPVNKIWAARVSLNRSCRSLQQDLDVQTALLPTSDRVAVGDVAL